jgi:hypothetical protein
MQRSNDEGLTMKYVALLAAVIATVTPVLAQDAAGLVGFLEAEVFPH